MISFHLILVNVCRRYLPGAVSVMFVVTYAVLTWNNHSHNQAFTTVRGFVRILTFLDLGNEKFKGFTDVLVIASTSFGPSAIELLGQLLAVLLTDLALLGSQVALVAYYDNRNPVRTLWLSIG